MRCAQFKELAGAWALGALEADEAAACDRHLREAGLHEGCEAAAAQARETAMALSETLAPVPPGPHVWQAIEQEIGGARRPGPHWHRPARWRERVAWTLAVAAAVAGVFLGRAFVLERAAHVDDERMAEERSRALGDKADADRVTCLKQIATLKDDAQLQKEALSLLEDPGTRVVTLAPSAGHDGKASALVNVASHRAIVLSSALHVLTDQEYELWVIRGTAAPRPAGFLRIRSDGTGAGEIDQALLAEGAPDALAVSIEPPGGRPTPTEVILVGALKS